MKTSGSTIYLISTRCHDVEQLTSHLGYRIIKASTIAEILPGITAGDAVLLLAPDYPQHSVNLTDEEWNALRGHRVYIEYPGTLPGLGAGTRREATRLERAWIKHSPRQADALAGVSTPSLMLYPAGESLIKIGKLAGYDKLAFAVGETPLDPFLFKVPERTILAAATRLSDFLTARLTPSETWHVVWEEIFQWLTGDDSLSLPRAKAMTRPTYDIAAPLPPEAQRAAVARSLQWFQDARMLLSTNHEKAYRNVEDDAFIDDNSLMPGGDGSGGVLEGYTSEINFLGLQPTRCWRRADCVAEVAGAFALGGALMGNEELRNIASRLGDWLYFDNEMTSGPRADPANVGYGLIGWHDRARYGRFHIRDGWDIYYGDDNARVILGTIAASGTLNTDKWLPAIIRCLLANLRTTGPSGLRRNAIWHDHLEQNGWTSYFNDQEVPPEWISPHYQCYLHACYLWLYQQTGDPILLDYAERGITHLMAAYPTRWRWTNGLQQERARMLLPLAWLVRVNPKPLYLEWLSGMARDLLAAQEPCGALREVMASGNGKYGPPQRHEDYGQQEASLLQTDGDPVADLLYTCNFAFLGLHEAAAATGDPLYRNGADKLAEFLIRIQTTSPRKEYSGLWYRAFDYRRWETWASDADGSWGAWCVETGWTQAWITAVLALREQGSSLWETYTPAGIAPLYEQEKAGLFPEEAVNAIQ